MKTCRRCRQTKALDEFYNHPDARDGKQSRCRSCMDECVKQARRAAPERWRRYTRNTTLRRLYNITPWEYDWMFMAQHGVCAICGTSNPGTRISHFHVDHDHQTGQIRGLLCESCNSGLGRFRHNEIFLQRAAEYLRRVADGTGSHAWPLGPAPLSREHESETREGPSRS